MSTLLNYKCKYCNTDFSSKSYLTYHQKNARYCLKIQGNSDECKFKCNYCDKILSSEKRLKTHYEICKEFSKDKLEDRYTEKLTELRLQLSEQRLTYETQIKEQKISYETQIKNLQDKLENIAIKAVQRNFDHETTIDINIDESDSDTESDGDIDYESECESDSVPESLYKLTPLEVGNGYTIEHRDEDGFINVTNLCKAGKKQFSNWNHLDKTKGFLKVLSSSIGIPKRELIKYNKGSIHERATWAHPQVAINIAQWISPNFDVKVSSWVYEAMMTGKVDITNTKSYKDLQKENKKKDIKIQFLTKKYVKSQPTVQYNEKNVIYILTTKLMKKERRYILGKSVDLTSRLSIYNKSDEHEVIFFASCKDLETMNIVENMVFACLNDYREQANRERFILPENEKVELFSNAIKKSIEFFK